MGRNKKKNVRSNPVRKSPEAFTRVLYNGAFFILIVFAVTAIAITAFYRVEIFAIELGLLALFLLGFFIILYIRNRDINSYVDKMSAPVKVGTSNTSVLDFPMPMALINAENGLIIWYNTLFVDMLASNTAIFNTRITDAIYGFDFTWLLNGQTVCPYQIEINGSSYRAYGCLSGEYTEGEKQKKSMAAVYFVNINETRELQRQLDMSKTVVGFMVIDNYDEAMKGLAESERTALLASVEGKISEWLDTSNCILTKYDRDKYIMVLDGNYLEGLIKDKFNIIETMRTVVSENGIQVTLSIGFGVDGENISENQRFSRTALDMALSRGGNQAVIKNPTGFEFFGGVTKALERRTRVRARVIATALSEMINESETVFIMGHQMSDIDSLGAAAGIVALTRFCGHKAKIILDISNTSARLLYERLSSIPEYANVFISHTEAIMSDHSNSLLVIVDTNRPEYTELPKMLELCRKVVVIDHHRRASSYIDNAALTYHEPYASSASEIVTEILMYSSESNRLARYEADALLSGIVLDTKNFTSNTGVRTFEAAAYLRRAGADITEVKRIFQTELSERIAVSTLVSSSYIYREIVAIVAVNDDYDRVSISKAADELLTVKGIQASFVMCRVNGDVNISARSMGEISVQIILEQLGGGGHLTMAGAQLGNVDIEESKHRLIGKIDQYLDEHLKS